MNPYYPYISPLGPPISSYSHMIWHVPTYWPTEEENREAHRRLGEWWAWKQYYRRFDRCCHGKR